MRRIRQHGGEKLNDINDFIPIIMKYCTIMKWTYSVQWCSGENAEYFESSADKPVTMKHEEFAKLYSGIFQTIDGLFDIESNNGFIRLLAVDSSFWEITTGIYGLEDELVDKFGLYQSRSV